jgi:hypothetical protein
MTPLRGSRTEVVKTGELQVVVVLEEVDAPEQGLEGRL